MRYLRARSARSVAGVGGGEQGSCASRERRNLRASCTRIAAGSPFEPLVERFGPLIARFRPLFEHVESLSTTCVSAIWSDNTILNAKVCLG